MRSFSSNQLFSLLHVDYVKLGIKWNYTYKFVPNTRKMSFQILEEVTKTSIELLLKEPFYAHFFSALNKEIVSENSDIRTLAVGLRHKNYVLLINSDFWQNTLIEKKHRYGVVKHEILHLVFKHLLVSESNKDHLLLNIAMDLVVNQYIDRSQLPKESLFLETFPELSLEKDQTYSYYYEKLQQLQQDCQSQINWIIFWYFFHNLCSCFLVFSRFFLAYSFFQ